MDEKVQGPRGIRRIEDRGAWDPESEEPSCTEEVRVSGVSGSPATVEKEVICELPLNEDCRIFTLVY